MSKEDNKEELGVNQKSEEFSIDQVVKNTAEDMRNRREKIAVERSHIRHSLVALTKELIEFEDEDNYLVYQINIIQMLLKPEIVNSVEMYFERDWGELELNTPIEFAGFSTRTYNCIKRAQINVVADLFSYEDNEYIDIKNLGKKSQDEIVAFKKQFLDNQRNK